MTIALPTAHRAPSGHTRSAHPADAALGSSARIRTESTDLGELGRSAEGRYGVVVSRAASIGEAGWVESERKLSENKQRTKVYALTAAGHQQLGAERSRWEELSAAIASSLNPPEASEA